MNPTPYSCIPRHSANVAAMNRPANAVSVSMSLRENKNAHAVALGKMTSKAKAEAAAKNGEKGGRPSGS